MTQSKWLPKNPSLGRQLCPSAWNRGRATPSLMLQVAGSIFGPTYLCMYSLSPDAFALALSENENRTAYLAQRPCRRTRPQLLKMYLGLKMMALLKLPLSSGVWQMTDSMILEVPWEKQILPSLEPRGNHGTNQGGSTSLSRPWRGSDVKYTNSHTCLSSSQGRGIRRILASFAFSDKIQLPSLFHFSDSKGLFSFLSNEGRKFRTENGEEIWSKHKKRLFGGGNKGSVSNHRG